MQEMKARDAHLDLLRIVSMLLIILLHSIDHSGVLEQADSSSGAMYFYVRFLYAAAQVCVNCYVMLSGYYLVESRFRLQKLVALWMEVAFYSFTFKALFMLTGQSALSPVSLLACFFPIVTGRYWFITIYVGMYAIFPFLNRLIHAMKKTEHAALNLCLFVLLSLWVSIHPAIAGMNSGGGWGLTWFVALYLAAAWLRLYYKPSYKAGLWFAVALIIPLIMAGAAAVLGGGYKRPCERDSACNRKELVPLRFRPGVWDDGGTVPGVFEHAGQKCRSCKTLLVCVSADTGGLPHSRARKRVTVAVGAAGAA